MKDPKGWIAQYYPAPASTVTPESAVTHSLVKWRGLREESLKAFGLTLPPIAVNGSTCALCYHYANANCVGCPLYTLTGKGCDDSGSPWESWKCYTDPEPMIEALTSLKENEDAS